EMNLGNVFYLPGNLELGFIGGVSYDSQWRNSEIVQRRLIDPENRVLFEDESVYSVDISGNLSFGLQLNSENSISTTSIWLRNTDDEVSQAAYFNANNLLSDGRGHRNNIFRYEQREMKVNQIHGVHELGWETLDFLGIDFLSFMEGLKIDWYISDSEATTDIPNEILVK